jgi:hypothetical protein
VSLYPPLRKKQVKISNGKTRDTVRFAEDTYTKNPQQVEVIVDYVKNVVRQPIFKKQYLIALKDHDEDTLHMVLQYGSEWEHDMINAVVCMEAIHDLKDVFSGFALWQAGSMIFGPPEKWPADMRKSFALEGERKKKLSRRSNKGVDYDDDDDDDDEDGVWEF